jgi:hypothetical protein
MVPEPVPPGWSAAVTRGAVGLSWSRFGPTVPEVPAALSVWQLPQVLAKSCLPAPGAAPPPAAPRPG